MQKNKSVIKAIEVLELLAQNKRGLRLIDVGRALGFSQTSTFNILATLQERGFVTKSLDGSLYQLGMGVLYLTQSFVDTFNLTEQVKSLIAQLAQDIGETAQLAVLGRMESIIIHQVESSKYLSISVRAGDRFPLHTSASGKSFLAYAMSTGEVDRFISEKGLPRLTDRTITDKTTLLSELEKIREQGYALEDEEFAEHVQGVAVPIRESGRRIRMALTMAGLKSRTNLPANTDLIDKMFRCARAIESQL